MFSINLTIQDITNEQTIQFLMDKLIETKIIQRLIIDYDC